MYSTLGYLYQQNQTVILLDASGTYNDIRYRPVFAKDLVASKGVDNVILFKFLNQEQKQVDVTGLTFTVRVMNREGTELLFTKELEAVDASKGQLKLTIIESDLDDVEAQRANYSITFDRNSLTEAIYLDDNAGARGTLKIVDATHPEFTASANITFAADPGDGSAVYSSEWNPEHYLQTIQYNLNAFEGTITVEASVNGNTPWYELESIEYSSGAVTASKYMNVEGWYNTMRLKLEYTAGSIDSIYVR
jgi:hypothetical protein